MNFDQLFHEVTGFRPFAFQRAFATAESIPSFVDAPTGSGKTAAVILGWLWRRRYATEAIRRATPRRLVYILPMRTLTKQTLSKAREWVLGERHFEPDLIVAPLYGGEIDTEWRKHPEKDAILVGTQDQILSRALMRGYAMSRYLWPMDFALVHNDAWWVLDEVQLMGAGVPTSAQLSGFRRRFGTYGPTACTWMSATLREDWLETPDLPLGSAGPALRFSELEGQPSPELQERLDASKPLQRAPHSDETALADWVVESGHQPGRQTLVIVNQVKRAQAIAKRIAKVLPEVQLLLLHSRLRGVERSKVEDTLQGDEPQPRGRIVVATQTIEAGVDLSAHTLITDLAPWPSLVQRFGRCNRNGKMSDAQIYWVDLDTDKASASAPYEPAALEHAREKLERCDNARIADLPAVDEKQPFFEVIRQKDLLGLFDTDPDLDGNFVDVSRYVRGGADTDVTVTWVSVEDESPTPQAEKTHPDWCVSVNIAAFKKLVEARKKKSVPLRIWGWDDYQGSWVEAHSNTRGNPAGFIAPGRTFYVAASNGGYDPIFGFEPSNSKPVPVEGIQFPARLTGYSHDPRSERDENFVALDVHLQDAAKESRALLVALDLVDADTAEQVTRAALWHDVGKAHEVFQSAIRGESTAANSALMAKAPRTPGTSKFVYARRGFRHELASALAAIQAGESDLVSYLAACHHGKVRLGLRPLPDELSQQGDVKVIRGIQEEDAMPEVMAAGLAVAELQLDLSPAELGPGSWSSRALRLLHQYGPFRLAFLETLVRAADWRASATPSATIPSGEANHG